MADLVIDTVDTVNIKVDCDRGLAKELSDFFTFDVPGSKYMPSYRNKMWDGKIKLYNVHTQRIYSGLEDYVLQFARERKYTVSRAPGPARSPARAREDVRAWACDHLRPHAGGSAITPHDHQIDAITHAMNTGRTLLLSPTASGKSLIIYALIRYYLDLIPKDKKILIVVPTTGLVEQMYSDFKDYSKINGWNVFQNCHRVMSGKDKTHDKKRVIISTWQSIYKMQQGYFDQFGAVIGDECHQFKAKSLTSIMTKLRDCPYRIGTTGTLDGSQCHKLVIEGLFGPVYKVTSTKKLMDKKLLTNLDIDCLLMSYPEHVRQQHKRMTYQEEIDWIVTNPERNEFITNLTSNLKGNTLVLFQFVEKHGKPLFEMIKERCPDRKCFFVYGGTDVDAREEVRRIAEEEDSAIIVASYGTFSTGISIRRLHNVVFSSPSKSRIRVLQSIGRQLRKSEHKEIAKLYDLGDDIHWKSYKNHTLRHFSERLKIYDAEGFNHKSIRIKLEGGSHE